MKTMWRVLWCAWIYAMGMLAMGVLMLKLGLVGSILMLGISLICASLCAVALSRPSQLIMDETHVDDLRCRTSHDPYYERGGE